MSWVELRVEVARAALDEAAEALFAHGTSGLEEVELEPGILRQAWDAEPIAARPPDRLVLKAFFESPERAAIERALAAIAGTAPPSWHDVPETNWEEAWRAGLDPIVISPRLVVAPPWNAPPGALVIEPGQGFGTGQHPSTRACLAHLEAILGLDSMLAASTGATCLDVGAGSGVLGLAAAKLGLRVRGIDVEPEAVAEAQVNAARNGLAAEFSATPVALVREPADLVFANLHAEVLVAIAPDLVRLTRRWLVIAGVLADRESRVRACFDPVLDLVAREPAGKWVSLRYRSRESLSP